MLLLMCVYFGFYLIKGTKWKLSIVDTHTYIIGHEQISRLVSYYFRTIKPCFNQEGFTLIIQRVLLVPFYRHYYLLACKPTCIMMLLLKLMLFTVLYGVQLSVWLVCIEYGVQLSGCG